MSKSRLIGFLLLVLDYWLSALAYPSSCETRATMCVIPLAAMIGTEQLQSTRISETLVQNGVGRQAIPPHLAARFYRTSIITPTTTT